ncbi:MAG TPA: hypothetical protein VHX44_08270 [Planctomycetota bacterium]|nr:hypothetical protein [Planctomycetota bacterium]
MADDPKSLSQDDIDALINQASGASSPAKPPAASSNTTPAKAPAAGGGALGQDDIDALINQVQATAAPTTPAALAVPAKPAAPAGHLGQDDIDALINQVQQSAPAPAPSKPAAASAASAATVSLDQDAIDALINPPANAPAAGGGSLDQDAIDALINPPTASTNKSATAKIKPPTSRAQRESSISQMLDSVQDAAKAKAQASAAPADQASGPLGQDDIDRLLSELGANTATKAGPGKPRSEQPSVPTTAVAEAARSQRPGTTSSNVSGATVAAPLAEIPGGPNAPTLALSAEDLDALVDRQVGVQSDHQEAPMIDQSDIDALVKQLANATGAPDTKKISDALAKHEGEIDKLLEQAGDAKVTLDAIPGSAIQGSGNPNAKLSGSATFGVPVMAPAELKGTRWLLAAAVLFLAMCATTLGMVVNAINGLSQELKTQR